MNWGILIVFGVKMYAISPRLRGKDPAEQFFGGKDDAVEGLEKALDAMTGKALE
jgi:hypothetical protein